MSDLIDRQALREDIEKIYKCDCQTFVVHYAQLIDDLPSAEQEPKWIPVTEALPEERKNVLVTTIDGDIKVSYRSDVTYWWNIGRGGVIAWMPLPEPWKGK